MMKIDKDLLECDLAETYHIFNMYELPLKKVALFSYGLRENSRIKLKMNGMNYSFETMLLAGALDRLTLLVWGQTKDGSKGINRPDSILSKLMGEETKTNREHMVFETSEDFERYWNQIISKGER